MFITSKPKIFRMFCITHFPFDKYDKCCKKQAPGKEIFDKKHWGKHHKISPVIDSAINTAFIMHHKGLKWTEKQYANIIA